MDVADYDLIFTLGNIIKANLGGDGSFLRASHFVEKDQIVIGVNTDNRNSKGHYCSLRELHDLDRKLQIILKGKSKEKCTTN